MRVNASSPQAAADNVRSTGNTPASDSGGGGGGSSSGGGGGGSTGGVSQQDMYNQLMAVGYNGPTDDASIQAAYARTVNGGNAPSNSGGDSGGGGSIAAGQQQVFNQQAQSAAQSVANQAAQNAYNQAQLAMTSAHYANMDQATKDQLAFDKAKEAYTESITTAGLTGTLNGAPTQAAIAQQAGLSGVYNGAPTEAARQFNVTAEQNAINQQDQTTQNYLSLLSGLRGPNDPFQYLRTLQGTPNGMADIVNAAAGRYQLGGTASGEIAPRATIQGQIDNMNNAQPGGSNSQDPNVQGLPPASQIDARNYNQMLPSQQAALWAAYQYGSGPSGAMNPADAQAMYKQSMPNYGGPPTGGVKLFTA